MCMYYLALHAPRNIINVTVIFPVIGQSFLPPDRVFGHIKTVIRRRETIVNPEAPTTDNTPVCGCHSSCLRCSGQKFQRRYCKCRKKDSTIAIQR